MGLVPFWQLSTLFCCCHVVLHTCIFRCIVENKPSPSLNEAEEKHVQIHYLVMNSLQQI